MPLFRALLSTRILAVVLALVAIGAVVTVLSVIRDQREDYLSRQGSALEANLRHDATWLREEVAELHQNLELLARVPPIQGILRTDRNDGRRDPLAGDSRQAWMGRLADTFTAFIDTHPLFYRVSYIGVADGGRELMRVEQRGERIVVVPAAELAAHGQRPEFQETLALADGEIYLSEFGSGQAGDSLTRRRRLHAATPVHAPDGQPFGMVVLYMDTGPVLDKITALPGDHVRTYVATERGDYLVHPDPERTLGLSADPTHRLKMEFPELAALLAPQAPAQLPLRRIADSREQLYVAAERIPLDPRHPERSLLVAYALPESVVAEATDEAHWQAALTGLVIGLFTATLAMYLVRRMLTPLRRITEAAREIAAGKTSVQLPTDSSGEVGALTGAFGTMLEQLKRRDRQNQQIQASLLESQGKLNSILDSLNEIITAATPDGEPLYINAAAERIFGCAREAFMGQRHYWRRFVHPDDRQHVEDQLRLSRETGVLDMDFRIVRGDGHTRWLNARSHAIRDADERIIRFDSITADITELKEAQENYRASAERVHDLLAHLETVREEQSAALARAVHDELGGTLTMLRLGLDSLGRKTEAAAPQVASLLSLAQEAIRTVRRIASNLRPDMLDNLGLAAAISGHLSEFSRLTGVEATLDDQLPCPCALPPAQRIAIFRVVQEALTNVAKHAQARRVTVSLAHIDQQLRLQVEDDGIGIDEQTVYGYGMLGMQERALYLRGHLAVRRTPGRGTCLSLYVPIKTALEKA